MVAVPQAQQVLALFSLDGVARTTRPMRDVFVGRAGQLKALNHLLDTAGGGVAVAAVVAGETGVGKSRLLREFERQARCRDAIVLRGACVNLAGGLIPYAP